MKILNQYKQTTNLVCKCGEVSKVDTSLFTQLPATAKVECTACKKQVELGPACAAYSKKTRLH